MKRTNSSFKRVKFASTKANRRKNGLYHLMNISMFLCSLSRRFTFITEIMFNPLIRFTMGYYDDDETYNEYNGTYVQDVEGWSGQMIDDVLDKEVDILK